MKLLIALTLFACILFASAQPATPSLICAVPPLPASPTIWSYLGGTDAVRVATITAVTTRAFGLLLGHECLGYHFYSSPPNLPQQFVAFLSTLFGGNPDGSQNATAGIGYRVHNQSTNAYILSPDVTGLLNALLTVHTAITIQISQQDQLAFKLAVVAVLNSFSVPANVTCNITALLNASDPFVVANNGAFSRACPTRDAVVGTIVYRNPLNPAVVLNITNVPTIICWVWSDAAQHSVQVVGTNVVTAATFGYGYDADPNDATGINALGNGTLCGATGAVCSLGLGPFTFCLRFDNTTTAKTYAFKCGIHGVNMSTTINVAATVASASPSPGVVSTVGVSASPSPSPTSSASVLSSFFSWF